MNKEKKQELYKSLKARRYVKIDAKLFQMLDSYDSCLKMEGNNDEKAEAAYLRGEAYFRIGRYSDTVDVLTKCLQIKKSEKYLHLDMKCYGILGMMFQFFGNEVVALENFLEGLKEAKAHENVEEEIVFFIDIACLYMAMGDLSKAGKNMKIASKLAIRATDNSEQLRYYTNLFYSLYLCRMEHFEEAEKMLELAKIYRDYLDFDYYDLVVHEIEFTLDVHNGKILNYEKHIDFVVQKLNDDAALVELYDNYLKICHLAIQHAKKEQAFRLLEVLDEKAQTNGHQYLYLQVCDYYLEFYSKYDMEQYAQKCKEYVQIEEAYSEIVKDFKIKSMKNTESLRETEREKERYVKKSRLDLATGLLNKAAWESETREYMQVRNADTLDAMIIIDLDDFKSVNDKYGHMTGDDVLCHLADVIKAEFSGKGILGRFGGDEFVIFATNINSIRQLQEQLLNTKNIFSEFSLGKDKECKSTVSIGVSWTKETLTSMETMFEYADKALYQAKSGGKNCLCILEIKDTL